jgi:hypothetical protein
MTRSEVDLNKFGGEKTVEICAIGLKTETMKMVACCIHRYPCRRFEPVF